MPFSFHLTGRVFWLVWLLMPIAIWGEIAQVDWAVVGATGRAAGMVPVLLALSISGSYLVFCFALALAHRIILRAADREFFGPRVLRTFRIMGTMLLVWPLLSHLIDNLAQWAVTPADTPVAFFLIPDVVVMGFGLFLLTIGQVLAEGLRLQRESELTV